MVLFQVEVVLQLLAHLLLQQLHQLQAFLWQMLLQAQAEQALTFLRIMLFATL